MSTTTPRRSFLMVYRAEDFPLYLLSLVLGGVLIVPALPHLYARVALVIGLAYLAVFFIIRHGAKFESSVFSALFEGITRYPVILGRSWMVLRSVLIPTIAIFGLAIAGERYLQPSLAGTKWLAPFPWQWAVWVPFLLLTVFRVAITIAHFLRASVVREVLQGSPQKRLISVLSIPHHIVHAFVTGMVAQLSLVAPCVLFFMWTRPTYLREALLVAGFLLWTAIATPFRKRKLLARPGILYNKLFFINHSIAHQSRFFFTVFHGHHHDAIPSAIIGSAAGTGFLENTDRSFTWLDPLRSIVVVQLHWAYMIAFDMVVHQYIPGVFPYVKPTMLGVSHHMTHHFGSALPLGIVFSGYIEPGDAANGYKPDNAVTRWFVAEAEKREGISPELGKKYLALSMTKTPPPAPVTAAVEETAAAPAAAVPAN